MPEKFSITRLLDSRVVRYTFSIVVIVCIIALFYLAYLKPAGAAGPANSASEGFRLPTESASDDVQEHFTGDNSAPQIWSIPPVLDSYQIETADNLPRNLGYEQFSDEPAEQSTSDLRFEAY